MVDNDILSPEQPPEEADWTKREKGGGKIGKNPDLAEFVFRSVEMARFCQSIQILFGNRKEFRRKK